MSTMTFEDWQARYKPVLNHLDENASYDGAMFETFGAELDHVRGVADRDLSRVWTLREEDGVTAITQGFGAVNRLGYFITEVAADADTPDEIIVDGDENDGTDGYGNPKPVPAHEALRIVGYPNTTD